MTDLELTLACWDYDRTRALSDGRVKAEGIRIRYLPIGMPESFYRMLHYGEFACSEMSLSWYTRTVFHDPRPFVAIPVFPSRMFRHGSIFVNRDAGINTPADLVGRRVGVPEYQMTAAVWIKGILADFYGVPVSGVEYFTGGLKEPGRREVAMQLPSQIVVKSIGDRRTLGDMLESGEIEALYTAEAPPQFVEGNPKIMRLFPAYQSVEREYLQATGIFPIMHVIVIRWDVYEEHPWVARSLYKAFSDSKAHAYRDLSEVVALKATLPWLSAHVESTKEAFGTDDYWPYGLDSNRIALETFLRYSYEQDLSPRLLQPDELFARETHSESRT